MITQVQLEELRDIFNNYDDEVLLQRISVSPDIGRGVSINITKIGWQEFTGLFPGVDPYAPTKDDSARL